MAGVNMTTQKIAIVGGGPCGLTLGRLLECRGVDYVIYERDESDSSQRAGGSLDIHPETGQRALQEGGLFDEFQKYARYDDAVFTLADKSGTRLFQTGQDRDAPEIDRRELRQILLNAIPKEKIQWGHLLKRAVLDDDGRPVLHFANGVVSSGFKLVVGADGAWSKVRPLVSPAIPHYTGKSYLEARMSRDNALYASVASKAGSGTTISIGSKKVVITQRQGDGSYRVYFGLEVPENFFGTGSSGGSLKSGDIEAIQRLLLSDEYYADWADEYKDLLRYSTDFRAWPLYSLSAEDMKWKSVPGLTLVGDAAHVAVPNGEGVNLAMVDALQLATKMAEHGIDNVNSAVQEYEVDMFSRGAETINDGKTTASIMFGEGPQPMVDLMKSFSVKGGQDD